jgi:hypothetical protein
VGLTLAVGIVLNYRRVRLETGINLGRLLAAPGLVALVILAGYWVLNRYTGLTELPLATRVVLKGVYAGAAFVVLSLLVQPRTTRARLDYVRHLALASTRG